MNQVKKATSTEEPASAAENEPLNDAHGELKRKFDETIASASDDHEEGSPNKSKAKSPRQKAKQHRNVNKLVVADYETDCVAPMKADGFGEHVGTYTDTERILVWMHGRGYFSGNKGRRIKELNMMIDKINYPEVHQRALRYIALGDIFVPTTLDYEATHDQWKKIAEEYGLKEGAMGWNAFANFGSNFIQRVHRSGCCFLQAPVVLQSYLVSSAMSGNTIEAINISKYARASFGDKQISTLIVEGGRGCSLDEFQNVLQKNKVSTFSLKVESELNNTSDCKCKCPCELFHELRTLGPALVGCFIVDQDFKNCVVKPDKDGRFELPYFEGKVETKAHELHAMVLIGMRKVDNEWRFLLQNWWPKSQLVEVSAEYFISSQATLTFALAKQDEIPQQFARCSRSYAEAQIPGQDGGNFYPER